MKDLVIGAITGYDFNAIRPWVNSLERSGYDGDRAVILYNGTFELVNELSSRGFQVFGFERNDEDRTLEYTRPGFNIVVERFQHYWGILQNFKGKYDRLIATDVKDVVFQRNPSEWLDANVNARILRGENIKIIASSESIQYAHEDWGTANLYNSFGPAIHQAFNDRVTACAGVLAGDFDTMIDLSLVIKLLCDAAPAHRIDGGGGPDQAAYNVLINSKPYSDITWHVPSEAGWAAQLGTTGPHIASRYASKLTEPAPIMKDGLVCTSTGEPFFIVHQYDRIPEWRDIIMERYA